MKEGGVVFQTLRKTKASLERQRQVGSWSRWRKSFSQGPQAGEVAGVPGDVGRQGSKKAGSVAANRPECALTLRARGGEGFWVGGPHYQP